MSRRLIVGVALVLVGAAALLASTAFHGRAEARRTGSDVPANPGARDPGDISANNSPTLAQNPLRPENLAVVNRIDTPVFSCALEVSQDGGSHWSRVAVPIPSGEEPKCYAPDLTFAADGTLYMSYVTLRGNGNRPHAVWLARSTDGGRTLSAPHRVTGPLAFQVRLAADPARPQRLYLTWLQAADVGIYRFAGPGNPIEVTRSDDGGGSWQQPVRVSDPRRGRVLAPAPVVGPGGALYVLYLDVGGDSLDYEGAHGGFGGPPYAGRFSLVLGRSTDGGATWQQSLVDDRLVPTRRFIAFLPPFPSVAVDPRSGRIFAAFEDGRLSPSDVYVWSLAAGARTWKGPTRINDTPAHDGRSQYLPKIAFAPNGRLDVVYYDRRGDPGNRSNSVSLQSSYDAGQTFTRQIALSDRAFDSGIGAGSERRLADLGSRLGLVSGPTAVLAAWTDTRAGTVASNKQDIAFATAKFLSASQLSQPARDALRFGGLALLLAGIALLLGIGDHRLRFGLAMLLLGVFWLSLTGAPALATQPTQATLVTGKGDRLRPVAYSRPPVVKPPNDPLFTYQWNLAAIQIPGAWALSRGAGATVAVLDTGVAYEDRGAYRRAPDLRGTRFVAGWDFVNHDAHPDDVPPPSGRRSHGTQIAGIIAQTADNGIGGAGVAPGAAIMPIRVLRPDLSGSAQTIARGLRFAADHGASVANLSIAGPSGARALKDAIDYAASKGVTIVAAAGNEGHSSVGFPAAYPNVISVGAVSQDRSRAYYSNYGRQLDLVAPGGAGERADTGYGPGDGVLAQALKGGPSKFCYCFTASTSAAAAEVSGVAALLIGSRRATTPRAVRAALLSGAQDLGAPGWDPQYGAGLVQAWGALTATGPLPGIRSSGAGTRSSSPGTATWPAAAASAGLAGLVGVWLVSRRRRARPGAR